MIEYGFSILRYNQPSTYPGSVSGGNIFGELQKSLEKYLRYKLEKERIKAELALQRELAKLRQQYPGATMPQYPQQQYPQTQYPQQQFQQKEETNWLPLLLGIGAAFLLFSKGGT
jgi:hypothetical protein